MKKYVIGIDGGISGAICVLQDDKICELFTMPIRDSGNGRNEYDVEKLVEFFSSYKDATVILEKAQYTPQLGGISSFSFGKSYGLMIGLLTALKIRFHIVAAKSWQKEMFEGQSASNTKAASEIIARRLYPNESFTATEKSKKTHSGMTDAALIATYGRRRNL